MAVTPEQARAARRAQRENAARIKEFRRTGKYKSALPPVLKGRAGQVRVGYLKDLLDRDPDTFTHAERMAAASAASYGAHGKDKYEIFDVDEFRQFWYH